MTEETTAGTAEKLAEVIKAGWMQCNTDAERWVYLWHIAMVEAACIGELVSALHAANQRPATTGEDGTA